MTSFHHSWQRLPLNKHGLCARIAVVLFMISAKMQRHGIVSTSMAEYWKPPAPWTCLKPSAGTRISRNPRWGFLAKREPSNTQPLLFWYSGAKRGRGLIRTQWSYSEKMHTRMTKHKPHCAQCVVSDTLTLADLKRGTIINPFNTPCTPIQCWADIFLFF